MDRTIGFPVAAVGQTACLHDVPCEGVPTPVPLAEQQCRRLRPGVPAPAVAEFLRERGTVPEKRL